MDGRNEELIDDFARTLQSLRRKKNLSQEELAGRAGLSTSYVSLLETRKRQPTLTVLAAVATVLGLSLSAFINEMNTDT